MHFHPDPLPNEPVGDRSLATDCQHGSTIQPSICPALLALFPYPDAFTFKLSESSVSKNPLIFLRAVTYVIRGRMCFRAARDQPGNYWLTIFLEPATG